jgi:hypothetical protein
MDIGIVVSLIAAGLIYIISFCWLYNTNELNIFNMPVICGLSLLFSILGFMAIGSFIVTFFY